MNNRTDHRNSLMRLLGAAEHLVSLSPVEPYSVAIPSYRLPVGVEGVDLHFSADADAVAQFAEAMGVAMSATPDQSGGDWYTETVATGELDGVPFFAWTRTSLPAHEVQHLSAKQVAA